MNLSAWTIIVDLLALVAIAAGFSLAFRQRSVRRLMRRLQGRDPATPLHKRAEGEDPVQYAMIIGGVMLMAFGLIMFAFTTSYAVLTASP